MTRIGTMLCVAVALIAGAAIGGGGLVQAGLGTGGEAIDRGALALAASGAPDAAPRTFGQCITNRTAYRTQSNVVSTISTDYVVMANTHLPVTHTAGCLIVDFAGVVATIGSANRMIIRAWIPGIGTAEPPLAFLGQPVTSAVHETRSMRFVFPNVPAGTHSVRIDWRSETGDLVAAVYRTLTVQYR